MYNFEIIEMYFASNGTIVLTTIKKLPLVDCELSEPEDFEE